MLSDEVQTIFEVLIQQATDDENEDAIRFFTQHKTLLQACREHGIDATFAETVEASGNSPLPDEMQQAINAADEAKSRYLQQNDVDALDTAVKAWQFVFNHPAFPEIENDNPWLHNNASIIFSYRFSAKGHIADLEAAISHSKRAVDLTPPNSPDMPRRLNNLGNQYSTRYGVSGEQADLEAGRKHYHAACERAVVVSQEECLRASKNWGNWALERRSWHEATEAYRYGIVAIDNLFQAQMTRKAKEDWLKKGQNLHARAGYAWAKMATTLQTAAATLEHG